MVKISVGEEMESKAHLVNIRIEADFSDLTEYSLKTFFKEYQGDKRTLSFIGYYNKTVLDKERLKFGEFKHQWAIQGMTKEIYKSFDDNYDVLREEISKKKDIKSFFEKYCIKKRKEGSFCSKLFHTILPSEFPPVDNPIRKLFKLQNEDFINSILIIKRGYELFIEENHGKLNLIRDALSDCCFSYLRVNELSDMRLLDMYYWFKESRKKTQKKKKEQSLLVNFQNKKHFGLKPLQRIKSELADKHITDSVQKSIFLNKATEFKQWANYIAALVLTNNGRETFSQKDIRKVLQNQLIPDHFGKPGAQKSSLLTADVEIDSDFHHGSPCLKRIARNRYQFVGFKVST
jgi:hypothetical protein